MGFFSWLFRKTTKTKNTDQTTLVDIDTSALSVQNYFKHPEFIDFNRKHRDHQKDAILKSENQSIGQITLPTGTGKTRIQLAIHLENLIHKTNNNDIGVYVIVAHRLALCNQLISDFMYLVSVKLKIPCNFLSVSSDNFNKNRAIKTLKKRYNLKNLIIEESLKGCNFKSTTIQDEIKGFVEMSRKQNRHVIVISTYDSFDRLKVLSNIDICTFDEAHTTTNEEFTSNINEVKSSLARQFFFTATRKVSGDTGGMNDEQFYGKVLHQISPKEMVEAGEIVIPNNYQIIKVSNDEGYNYDNPIMVVRTIVEGFKEHLQAVKKHSCSPEKIGAKLLVTCEGANQLEDVVKDTAFQLWAKEANIKVVSLSSYQEREGYIQVTDDKVAFVNKSRNELLEMIYDMSDEENAILLHVDILAEGIDLPCITGIMPLREMSVSKLQQTLGRATRLIQTDRINLYQGKIKPSQYDKYVKPFAWVLLPEYLVENTQFIKNTIESLYRDYNIHPEHYSKGEQYLSDPKYDLPPLNTPEQINRKMHEGDLTHVFELSAFLNSLDLTQEALEKYIVDRFDDYDKKKNEIVENNS